VIHTNIDIKCFLLTIQFIFIFTFFLHDDNKEPNTTNKNQLKIYPRHCVYVCVCVHVTSRQIFGTKCVYPKHDRLIFLFFLTCEHRAFMLKLLTILNKKHKQLQIRIIFLLDKISFFDLSSYSKIFIKFSHKE